MNTRCPSSCFGAVSSVQSYQIARTRIIVSRINIRHYANQASKIAVTPERQERAALLAVEANGVSDPINPPRSTLPPLLKLPTRGPENVFLHYYRTGRAYGGFYFTGVKAVWFNYKASKVIRERIKKAQESQQDNPPSILDLLTRSEYQLLARNSHDIGKLPLFGVLVALLGEWLPLFVPFMPGVVPGTCRIPKQVVGMREKAEQRRRTSFRRGIQEPSKGQIEVVKVDAQIKEAWPMSSRFYAASMLGNLRDEQLFHISSSLNVHSRMWDWFNIQPPSFLLRRALAKRLSYLAGDDFLLAKDAGQHGKSNVTSKLSLDEVNIACEERGIDVNGRCEDALRENLKDWLSQQQSDKGVGHASFKLLFRRPNAWKT